MAFLFRVPRSTQVLTLGLPILVAGSGCVKSAQVEPCRPSDLGHCIIEDVSVEGNDEVSSSDIEGRIATAETSHLLGGAFQNVPVLSILDAASVEYQRFDRFVFARDLARVERYYRARGFYEAHARAGRVMRRSDGRVRVEIVVDEGQPVKIGRVDIEWKGDDPKVSRRLTKSVTEAKDDLKIGERFEEETYENTKKRVLRAMTDRGFAYATVTGNSVVDLVQHEAQITLTLEPGPRCVFGEIKIVGLGELPEPPIRTALGFKKGDEYSTSDLESAQIALSNFGVFGAIDARPELSPPDQPKRTEVPVTIEVQPAPLRAVRAGVGAEVGSVVEAHVVGGWDNLNFLGGLRRLSLEVKPGVVIYPWTISNIFEEAPKRALPQIRSRLEFAQPLPFDPRTSGRVSAQFNLYSPPRGEGEPTNYILGYRTYSGSVGVDRPFFDAKVHGSLAYNIELDDPFAYFPDESDPSTKLPKGFGRIFVPSLQTVGSFDLRRDANGRPDSISPNKGIYVRTDVQFAGRFLGGNASDVRISPEFRGYVPISRRVTLAFRWATGFILASDYPDRCADPSKSGAAWDNTCSARDVQLLGLRGFFSGGSNSNRGYAYRGVGPHQKIESIYLVPGTFELSNGAVPLGGLTLWETSMELRFPIVDALGGALFVDGSDVSLKSGDLRFNRPHLSAGFGLRYATPVGPARLDVGFRIPCAQVIGICDPDEINRQYREEGDPGELLGIPMAISLGIGEAY